MVTWQGKNGTDGPVISRPGSNNSGKKLLYFLRVNLYILDIYAYDSGLQEGGYTLFSVNRPGIAFLCHATSQDSLAAQSSSEAHEIGPSVLQDRVVSTLKAPEHPLTAEAPMNYPSS